MSRAFVVDVWVSGALKCPSFVLALALALVLALASVTVLLFALSLAFSSSRAVNASTRTLEAAVEAMTAGGGPGDLPALLAQVHAELEARPGFPALLALKARLINHQQRLWKDWEHAVEDFSDDVSLQSPRHARPCVVGLDAVNTTLHALVAVKCVSEDPAQQPKVVRKAMLRLTLMSDVKGTLQQALEDARELAPDGVREEEPLQQAIVVLERAVESADRQCVVVVVVVVVFVVFSFAWVLYRCALVTAGACCVLQRAEVSVCREIRSTMLGQPSQAA